MTAREDQHALAAAEAEAAILGGLLLDNRLFDLLGDLRPEHFGDIERRMVFTEVISQIAAGKPADVISVGTSLAGRVEMASVHALTAYIPSAASFRRHAAALVERQQSLVLVRTAGEVADLAADHARPIAERLDAAQAMLAALATDTNTGDDWTDAYSGMVEHSAVLEARAEGRVVAYSTGLTELDEHLDGGLRPGQLVIVAARPAVGKSAFAQTVAVHMAAERAVGFVSLEMSRADVFDRLTAMLGRVPMPQVMRPTRGEGLAWDRVVEGTEKAKALKFFVLEQPGATIRQIAMRARILRRQRGMEVLVIDYLGLMAGLDQRQNRVHQIEEISRGLKCMAKELGIVVIALSQLNRAVESRADSTPILSDLRDSGAIEQDADIVLMLDRPVASNPGLGGEWAQYAKIRIAKVRQGRTGDVNLRYIGEQVRFEDWIGPKPSRAEPARAAPRSRTGGM